VNFASDVEDLRAAANAMAAAGMSPSLLVGHSLGGTAAIVAAADMPDIAAVATIGAPADLQHILRLFGPNDLDTIASEGEASVEIAGRPFLIRRGFLEAVEGIDVEKAIASLRRPVLVMHSPLDQVVGIDHASRIFVASRHPKASSRSTTRITFSPTSRTRTTPRPWWRFGRAAFSHHSADLPQVEVAEGVVSTETLAGTFQLKVRSGEHTLFADEPASVGGLGTGLSPYELVSAGLAACTVMTMRLYANRKGFPLERASTTVQHEKVPDMMPPDRFTRTIVLDGPLSDDQRARILAIADRCPVDLSLIRGSDVQTELLSASQAADPARLA
jgi:putative redox protein